MTLADQQIVIDQGDEPVRLSLEDLAWIMLDTQQATLTSALLSACMEAGVAIYVTDGRHLPSGVALPFHRHHRQSAIAHLQADIGTPLKKRLWQAIITAKVKNQSDTLDSLGRDGAASLSEMARHVGSGDPGNVEARAAREYWSKLFANFRRDDDGDTRNMALNYGYAVVRGAIGRAVTASGLLPAFGINHASVTNSFNLADDLIEPFRPFVDQLAVAVVGHDRARDELSLERRRQMAGILLEPVRLGHETMSLLAATEAVASSLIQAMESRSAELLRLPSIKR